MPVRQATIIQGDALAVLRAMPAGSVHCCVTSPPYWGLRDYGVQPSVWGGDPGCAHRYGEILPPAKAGPGNKPGSFSTSSLTNPARQNSMARGGDAGAFCRCGSWRGIFGLEPTP